MNVHELGVSELRSLLDKGELSAAELVAGLRRRIEAVEPQVQAFLEQAGEELEERAAAFDNGRSGAAGETARGALAGIPFGVKDNLCTLELHTTCASQLLADYRSPFQSTAVTRLIDAGGSIMGKTNLDEFAMGSSCEFSSFHPTRNPWDVERVPGGSSGGSAAAVAAGEVPFALGTDTGGSIRQPAAFCGVVGFKPSYGRVSRYGAVAFASSLDQIGPIARSVEDAAIVFQAMAGHDPMDVTSMSESAPDVLSQLGGGVQGLRIGIPDEYFGEGLQPEVRVAVEAAIQKFTELGAHVERCSLPHTEHALLAYYVIAPAEASSNLARLDGVRYGKRVAGDGTLAGMYSATRGQGLGPEVKRRILLGTYFLSEAQYEAYYVRAQRVRTLIRREFEQAFQNFDLLLTPTTPSTAFALGSERAPHESYQDDMLTTPANLAGLPALSLPCGFAEGLPIGMQLIGRPFEDATVLRAGHAYQQATDHHQQRPSLAGAEQGAREVRK